MADETLNEVGRLLIENSAAEALGLTVAEVRVLSLREFIDRATDRGLDVDVEMKASRSRTGGLSVTYRPDRSRAKSNEGKAA